MKKITALFTLFSLIVNPALANFPKDTQAWPGYNLIGDLNPGFENGTTQWTASGGAYSASTSIYAEGLRAAQWTPGAAGQTLTGPAAPIGSNIVQAGRSGVGSCLVRTAATGHVLEVVDGSSTVLGSATVTPSAAGFTRATAAFTFPNGVGTSARIRLKSGDTTIAYMDSCYLGPVDGFNYVEAAKIPVEYITNSDAEQNTDGWATYADAAGTAPVDGTGGTANITWTRTTTTPIRGNASFLLTKTAANRQGEGVSYGFSVQPGDRAKVLSVKFDYEVASGDYRDDEITVWIYDVTNSTLIQPAGYQLKSVGSGTTGTHTATFQTSASGVNYRLIFHISSTDATRAYTIEVDRPGTTPMVGPQSVTYSAPVTDWQSYTPTITVASGTVPTFSSVTGSWRRVGDSIEADVSAVWQTATTFSGGIYASLPAGLSIDLNKTANLGATHAIGFGYIRDAGLGNFPAIIRNLTASTTTVEIQAIFTDTTNTSISDPAYASTVTSTSPFTFGATDEIRFRFSAPISGWSSSVQMASESSEGRVVAASAFRQTSAQSISGSTDVKVQFNAERYDTHSAFDSTTNYRFTAPVPGYYSVMGRLATTATTSAATQEVYLYRNGSGFLILGNVRTNTTLASVITLSGSFYANAGDYFEIFINPGNQSSNILSSASTFGGSSVDFIRSSGNTAIAASETVAVSANNYSNSGSVGTSGSGDLILWSTEVTDSHGAFSSGVFTAPVSGIYSVRSQIQSSLSATTASISLMVYKAATLQKQATTHSAPTAGRTVTVFVEDSIPLLAGEQVSIRAISAFGNATYSASAVTNYVYINRIGNY